eukprot:CAMPEP_0197262158 /NCGR_PEP_ID=MMETSP1432-20130617/356_1 /TAXON_ID=44447 /ORGANISM="Pseudo-nitzschia delicatissima, Strain UNC1205" /LENGTH=389 /DNA_ID=CAMNT_0042726457 /DNA_START=333 /DNA_END=1502 /DNA_ORIENTATION=-
MNGIVYALDRLTSKVDQLTSKFDQLNSKVDQIKSTVDLIQGKPAKEKAKALTISLFSSISGASILGHGVLLRCQDEKRFAILTAAHVAVAAFHWFQKGEGHYKKVRFLSGTEFVIDEKTPAELFVHPEYVRKGIHDFGVLIVSFETMKSECQYQDLVLSSDDPFSMEHFGRASDVQFKSTPTMVNEQRVRLPTESKPGCSGTPLFSPCGQLLSVLHGVSKHRGGHTRLHSGDGNELTTHVYVDMVKDLGNLICWGKDCAKGLYHLENLTEEEEKDPKLKLKKSMDDSNDTVNPSTGALDFYREVKKLRSAPINGFPGISEIISYFKAKFFPVVNNLRGSAESTPDAFLKDHFTLADICNEIILHAQAKSNITLADRLSSESGSYQAACC